MICRKKSGGHRASNKNIRKSSYRTDHQLYILLSFDSVLALEIHDVARQDEPNRAPWLATRAGKMELGATRSIPQIKFPRKPNKNCFIDQACSVQLSWPHTWSITHSYSLRLFFFFYFTSVKEGHIVLTWYANCFHCAVGFIFLLETS